MLHATSSSYVTRQSRGRQKAVLFIIKYRSLQHGRTPAERKDNSRHIVCLSDNGAKRPEGNKTISAAARRAHPRHSSLQVSIYYLIPPARCSVNPPFCYTKNTGACTRAGLRRRKEYALGRMVAHLPLAVSQMRRLMINGRANSQKREVGGPVTYTKALAR